MAVALSPLRARERLYDVLNDCINNMYMNVYVQYACVCGTKKEPR